MYIIRAFRENSPGYFFGPYVTAEDARKDAEQFIWPVYAWYLIPIRKIDKRVSLLT